MFKIISTQTFESCFNDLPKLGSGHNVPNCSIARHDSTAQHIQGLAKLGLKMGLPKEGYTFVPAIGTDIHNMVAMIPGNIICTDIFSHKQAPKETFPAFCYWSNKDESDDSLSQIRIYGSMKGIISARLEQAKCTIKEVCSEKDYLLFKFRDMFGNERTLMYLEQDHTKDSTTLKRVCAESIQVTAVVIKAVEKFVTNSQSFKDLIRTLHIPGKTVVNGTECPLSYQSRHKVVVNDVVPDLHTELLPFCYGGQFHIVDSVLSQEADLKQDNLVKMSHLELKRSSVESKFKSAGIQELLSVFSNSRKEQIEKLINLHNKFQIQYTKKSELTISELINMNGQLNCLTPDFDCLDDFLSRFADCVEGSIKDACQNLSGIFELKRRRIGNPERGAKCLWNRIGLGEAFCEKYTQGEDEFWGSEQTLINILNDLNCIATDK